MIAKIKYRDYVPSGTIAMTYCKVEFLGKDAADYESTWHDIEFEKYRSVDQELKKREVILTEWQKELVEKEKRLTLIEEELFFLRKRRPCFRFWNIDKDSQNKVSEAKLSRLRCIDAIDKQQKEIQEFMEATEQIKRDRWYSAQTLVHKAQEFLMDNKFKYFNENYNSDTSATIEIWKKGE